MFSGLAKRFSKMQRETAAEPKALAEIPALPDAAKVQMLPDPAKYLFALDASNDLTISWDGDAEACDESRAIWRALRNALSGQTRLQPDIFAMRGMSGRRYRIFINDLISAIHNPRYLEIGSWAGSTACSAMCQNALSIVCIDNWSEFGGPKAEFESNIAAWANDKVDFRFIESDFRAVDYTALGPPFNVYLFDGPHAYADQYEGVLIAAPALTRTYIQIVDDWNWPDVRNGTWDAFQEAGIETPFWVDIRTSKDDTQPLLRNEHSQWHNGYFISVCRRPEK